jgi:hypothetical protein
VKGVDEGVRLNCTFAMKINKLPRHARVLSKYPGVSCQSPLHLDSGAQKAAGYQSTPRHVH